MDQREEFFFLKQECLTAKMHLDHLFEDGAMAKRRGVRIDKKEEQIVRSRTGTERIERITARFEGGKLLLFEERLRRIRTVSPECYADDLFSGGNVRRARTFGFRAQPLRDQPPCKFIDLRIRINSCRSQEFLELPEAIREHLLL